MTILLVLRHEPGLTDTATDGVITTFSESTPTATCTRQYGVSTSSPSSPTVSVAYNQQIAVASKSEPLVTYELS
jgi:hypothetical protein